MRNKLQQMNKVSKRLCLYFDPMFSSAPALWIYTCILTTLISKIFFSDTAWTIKGKFDVETPSINGHGHMDKMTAMPIYGVTFEIITIEHMGFKF